MPEFEYVLYYGDDIVVVTGRSIQEAFAKVDQSNYPVPIECLRWSGWKNGFAYTDN